MQLNSYKEYNDLELQNLILKKTEEFVFNKLSGEGTGHDWWHVDRVRKLSLYIAQKEENTDLFIVHLGALLHDIADHKFHGGDEDIGPSTAKIWLESLNVSKDIIQQVCDIVATISFKGAKVKSMMKTKEGMVVQDADRLDALGAIGIARCFAYGGFKGNSIYDPEIKFIMHESFDQYKNSKSTSINHFYEKLLLLKNLMNTQTAKLIAQDRHEFMQQFLDQFFKEWNVDLNNSSL